MTPRISLRAECGRLAAAMHDATPAAPSSARVETQCRQPTRLAAIHLDALGEANSLPVLADPPERRFARVVADRKRLAAGDRDTVAPS